MSLSVWIPLHDPPLIPHFLEFSELARELKESCSCSALYAFVWGEETGECEGIWGTGTRLNGHCFFQRLGTDLGTWSGIHTDENILENRRYCKINNQVCGFLLLRQGFLENWKKIHLCFELKITKKGWCCTNLQLYVNTYISRQSCSGLANLVQHYTYN